MPRQETSASRSVAFTLAVSLVLGSLPGIARSGHGRDPVVVSFVALLADAETEYAIGTQLHAGDVVAGGERRLGIEAFAPSRIRYRDVPIPPGARLELAAALPDDALAAVLRTTLFEVRIGAPGSDAVAWSRTIQPGEIGWRTGSVDLAPWSGGRADVTLVTRSESGGVAPALWDGPRIRAPAPPPDANIETRTVVASLIGVGSTGSGNPHVLESWADVPRGGVLDVAVSAIRINDARAHLRVTVDGVPALDETLVVGARGGLRRLLPLDAHEGRQVQICLEGSAGLAWQHARIWTRRTIPRSPPEERSLLLMVVDTLRADRLGAYGNPGALTPHLDRLSRRSELWSDAASQASWTLPSVASLLSGRYPPVARTWATLMRHEPGEATLPEVVSDSGRGTVAVVANPMLSADTGAVRGFERFVHIPGAGARSVHQAFLEWLDSGPRRGWFAYVHTLDPHHPYDPPEPERTWLQAFSTATINLPRYQERLDRGESTVAELAAGYDAEVLALDREIGGLLEQLRQRGLREETIVALAADHGEELHEHGLLSHGRQLYQESTHVPVIVDDGRAAALRTEPRELRSLLAMLLSRLGVAASEPSAAGTVACRQLPLGGTGAQRGASSPQVSVRKGDWKYVEQDGRTELFHLPTDPGETIDRFRSEPAIAAELARRARELRAAREGTAKPAGAPSPGELEALKALGYVD